MEAIGVVISAVSVGVSSAFLNIARYYIFLGQAILIAREPSKLYDTALSWKPQPGLHRNFLLHVFDVSLSTRQPAGTLIAIEPSTPSDPDVDRALGVVPAQEERTVRVDFAESFDSQKLLPTAMPLSTESAPIMSQWGLSSEPSHWEIDTYTLSLEPMLRGGFGRPYIDSVSIAAGTTRRTMRCMFHSLQNGRIIWLINVESMTQDLDLLFDPTHLRRYKIARPTAQSVFEHQVHFCGRLRSLLEAHSDLALQLGCTSGYKKLLLLLYSKVVVDDYCHQVYRLQAQYARKKEGLSDPRRAKLTLAMLSEITRDAYFYDEVKERINNLAGAIDTLIESLKLQLTGKANLGQLQSMTVDLQSSCSDLKRIMGTLSATLENHLKLHELSRGYHEAQKVGLLSILASVFLPLSLASGLLSMQTRVADLHYLLYDFFGVLVLLGSVVIMILVFLRTYLWLRELLLKLDRNSMFKKYFRPAGSITFLIFFFVMWALVLSSFLVGMIRDVGLGLKILGFGVAITAGLGGPVPLFFYLVVRAYDEAALPQQIAALRDGFRRPRT